MISEALDALDRFQEDAIGVAGNTLGGIGNLQAKLNAILGKDQASGPQPEKVADDGEPRDDDAPVSRVSPWVWVGLAALTVVVVGIAVARRAS